MKTIPEVYHEDIEMIVKTMRGFMLDGHELQGMAFLGQLENNRLLPVPMPMGDIKEKNLSAARVTQLAKLLQPDFIILISEAWLKENPGDLEKVRRIAKEGVEHEPDRREIVMLTLETRQGAWLGYADIKSLGGDKRGFGELQFIKGDTEGRFAHLLAPDVLH